MKIFTFITLIAFLISTNVHATPRKLTQEWKKVVHMYVLTKNGKGSVLASGIPIDKSLFLTAGHFCSRVADGVANGVLEDKVSVKFMNANDEIVTLSGGQIIKSEFSLTQDLCLVKLPRHGIKPVKIALMPPTFGEKVYLVGAPSGVFPVITDGYVGQGFIENMPPPFFSKVLSSAACAKGNSGGALFNEKGEVVAVAVMVDAGYPHISFGVGVFDIWRFIFE